MDIDHLFFKHRKLLLWLANTAEGRYLLDIKDKDRVVKVTPNSFHQLRGFQKDRAVIQARIYCSNGVAKILAPILTKLEILDSEYKEKFDKQKAFLHYAGYERSRQFPQIYLATATFNIGTEGLLSMNGEYTYAYARASTTADSVEFPPPYGDGGRQLGAFKYGGGTYNDCCRSFFSVDTSSLGAGATVTATLFRWSRDTRADTFAIDGIVCPSTQASDTNLVATDYDNFTYTAWSDVITPTTASTTYTWTFNAAGIAGVNKTGYTKFVLLNYTFDYSNGTPTRQDTWMEFYTHISGSGATLPNIYVTYTLPPATTNYLKDYRRASF